MTGVEALELILSALKKDEQQYPDWPEITEAAYILNLWAKRVTGSAGEIAHHQAPVLMLQRSAVKVGALAIRMLMNINESPAADDGQARKERSHDRGKI